MNQVIDILDGIDALLNGDTGDFSSLSQNRAYYTPQAAASVAPAADSLENMIGLSDLIYSDGGNGVRLSYLLTLTPVDNTT